MNIKQIPLDKYFEENNPKAIVLHMDLGTEKGTIQHLQGTVSASYHFYVPKHAKYVIQFVPTDKGAWHAGRVHKPTARAHETFGDINPNKQSIGICYEGRKGQKANDAQVRATAEIIRQFDLQALPLFAHQEITHYKPMEVHDFRERVSNVLNDQVCTLEQFTTKELINEVIRRYA